METQSVYQLFRQVATANADRIAYRVKREGVWSDLTWTEHFASVRAVAKSLIASGVKHGDRVAILAKTCLDWIQADVAIVSSGAVTVGIYPSNLGPDCAYVLEHSGSEVLFVENQDQLDKILAIRREVDGLRCIVRFDGPSDLENDVLSWDDFIARGASVTDAQVADRGERIVPDDLATLVYTSGTTGVPKGVMISHKNLLFTTWSVERSLYLESGFVSLHFLPMAHIFARLMAYCCLRAAVPSAIAEDLTKVPENIREIRPHFFASVPRIYEKVYEKITTGVEDAGGFKGKLFGWALGVGRQVSPLVLAGRPIPPWLRLRHAVANRLVMSKIQQALGGRLVWAISGAAPLNQSIAEFFHACGITILEGIGMTENTSFSHVNRIDNNRFGTVGQPGPGIEVKLAEDGEILFRGDNVMQGYYRDAEATAETIDGDGWLHSGDIGEIDADGFLKVTDRKKDLIITAGGKNVAPQRIERILRTSPYISQVMAYGDRRRYITALVTLDPENIRRWARIQGLGDVEIAQLATDPRVVGLLRAEIDHRNSELASYETVKRFHILPDDLTVENDDLTPTLKLKRKVVTQKYGHLLDALYDE